MKDFARFQDTAYQTAVIKDPTLLAKQTKRVTTSFGDDAVIVHGPGQGDCLPIALLRGLVNGGRPLSTNIEHDGMMQLRDAIAKAIETHNWPHDKVAAPQTIQQCADETREEGKWMGELAMAAFAKLCNVELKLWRYPGDKKDCKIIEPLMSSINEGADRQMVIHLLQTRDAQPGKPGIHSLWEAVIMKPPPLGAVGIMYGPYDDNDGYHCYDWIEDSGRKPTPLRISVWDKVILKGKGKKPTTERIVCQLRRKGGKGVPQIVITAARGKKLKLTTKPIQDVVWTGTQPTAAEVDVAKAEMVQAISGVTIADTSGSTKRGRNEFPRAVKDKKEKGHEPVTSDNDSIEVSDNETPKRKKSKTATSSAKKKVNGNENKEPAIASSTSMSPKTKNKKEEKKSDTPRTARMMKCIENMQSSFEQHRNDVSQQIAHLQSTIVSQQAQIQAQHELSSRAYPAQRSQYSFQPPSAPSSGSFSSPPRVRTAAHHHFPSFPPNYHNYSPNTQFYVARCFDTIEQFLNNDRAAMRQYYQSYP
jgi:hypothetical protein